MSRSMVPWLRSMHIEPADVKRWVSHTTPIEDSRAREIAGFIHTMLSLGHSFAEVSVALGLEEPVAEKLSRTFPMARLNPGFVAKLLSATSAPEKRLGK